jgi:periplasmic copper chaperone A
MRLKIYMLVIMLLLSGCGGQEQLAASGIEVSGAWARPAIAGAGNASGHGSHGMEAPMAGSNSAAYMVITNNSSTPERLLRVESNAAQTIEMHETTIIDEIASMAQVEAIEAPANGQVELKPGGLHIMFIGLTRDLAVGDQIELTLVFENAGRLVVTAEVRAP